MLLTLYYSTIVMLCLKFADGATTQRTSIDRPRTLIKWLINTGNVVGRWSPPMWTKRNTSTVVTKNHTLQCRTANLTPNTITRMQMIRGGTAAVLVMPTGDGSHRCCGAGAPYRYSLGIVELKHGINNLYPTIRPFPNWKSFAEPGVQQELQHQKSLTSNTGDFFEPSLISMNQPNSKTHNNDTAGNPDHPVRDESITGSRNGTDDNHDGPRIVNAIDAYLDDRGRLLWVLDTGGVGENACYGNETPNSDQSSESDNRPPPKFFAVDVHTNKIISFVSLSQVWRPGVSCFQYIVAIYPDTDDGDEGGNTTKQSTSTAGCQDWPLVFVGDAGTNRIIVYLHSKDRFTEIMLPAEEEKDLYEKSNGGDENDVKKGNSNDQPDRSQPRPQFSRKWSSPPIRDILYVVTLFPKPGQSKLLITYHGCREIYTLKFQLSNVDSTTSRPSEIPAEPVTNILTFLGRKPCRMVILGTDRRRTDAGTGNANDFAGGGTTLFFRIENTNDIWSWDTGSLKRTTRGCALYIDEREFRLVRLGRTCRVPVSVSAAPMTAAVGSDGDEEEGTGAEKNYASSRQTLQQVLWTLETNFVDHFAGTADQMGVNAKLQPIETSMYGKDSGKKLRFPPLRVQPSSSEPDGQGITARPFRWAASNRDFPHE